MRPDDPRHGTTAGYNAHVKEGSLTCRPCRDAKTRYEKRRHHDAHRGTPRKMPSIGSRRRIHALQRLGWSLSVIAHEAGWNSAEALQYVMRSDTIYTRSYLRIRDVYERLSMSIPPMTSGSVRARNRAIRNGYAPPLAWDDIDHDPGPSMPADEYGHRVAYVVGEYHHLRSLGISEDQIAKQLDVDTNTLHAYLREHNQESEAA